MSLFFIFFIINLIKKIKGEKIINIRKKTEYLKRLNNIIKFNILDEAVPRVQSEKFFHINRTYEPSMTFQSIPINTIKLIPINNQKTVVSSSFLMPNLIIINTKILAPTNIQKKVVSVIILNPEPRSLKVFSQI